MVERLLAQERIIPIREIESCNSVLYFHDRIEFVTNYSNIGGRESILTVSRSPETEELEFTEYEAIRGMIDFTKQGKRESIETDEKLMIYFRKKLGEVA